MKKNKKIINLDPFNEFPYLERRQQNQLKYLNENRHLIDPRISDDDIMMLYDKGIDAVSVCREEVHLYDVQIMNEIYQQIKSECELPVALVTYTYRDFDGVLHPFGGITINFRDNDETNIKKMEKIKSKYGEFFMFFNNSTEGKEFWKNNQITIIPK